MIRASRLQRFFIGLGLLIALLAGLFALFLAVIPNWGASQAEIDHSLPSDEIVAQPLIIWNHAVTIGATPEQIWPWLVQMGDTRGGYYSYMFIEKAFGDTSLYNNADRIHAEWQNPPKGQGMIGNFLVLEDYQVNRWLLAKTTDEAQGFYWTWLWALEPVDAENTRLLVRHRILPPTGFDTPLLANILHLTGYVMEKNMIEGIRQRAEGVGEPPFIELVEIALWLMALCSGFAAATLVLTRSEWMPALVVGLADVVVLFVLTYIQPEIWLRVLLVAALLAAVLVVARRSREEKHTEPQAFAVQPLVEPKPNR